MAEEYRISVGIDASAAAQGSATFKGATLEIMRSADGAVEHVYGLEEGFKKVTKAADGTVVVEYARTLDEFGKASKAGVENLKDLGEGLDSTTDKLKLAAKELGVFGYEAKDALGSAIPPANLWDDATQSLRQFSKQTQALGRQADEMAGAVRGATEEISAELRTLNEGDAYIRSLAKAMAEMGQLDTAKTLTDIADAFRETYQNIVNTRPELAELSKGFDALTEGSKSLDTLTSAFLDFSREATRMRAELEAGVITAEEYQQKLRGMEQRVVEAAAELYSYRNELIAAANASAENATAVQELLPHLDQMISGYGQAKAAIDEYQATIGELPPTVEGLVDATGGFSAKLAEMAQEAANAGDALQASRLFDLSDEFKELEQHISAALAPGSELMAQLAESTGRTEEEISALYTTFGKLLADITETRLSFEQGQMSVVDYTLALQDLNQRVANLTPDLAELRGSLQLETNAEEASKEIEDMLEKLGSSQQAMQEFTQTQQQAADAGQFLNNAMTTLGVSLGKLSGVLLRALGLTGVTALFYKSFAGANQFSDSLVRLTNMAQLTEVEAAQLTDTMKALADEFGNSSTEEAAAALSIMSRGFREAADASKILAEANRLADATFSQVGTAASSLSQAMAAFEMKAGDAKDAAETLAVASGGSAEAMQQMAFMAGRLGAVMNQAGVSLKDYAIAVSALRQGGMENRRAIMGLTQVVQALSNMTVEAAGRFEDYGIKVNKARIQHEGLAPIIQEIYEKTKGNKAAIQELTGSYQTATIIMALMRNNGELLAKSMENMTNKSRLMDEQAKRVNDTFTKQLDNLSNRLLNRFKVLGDTMKESVIPALRFLNDHATGAFNALKALAGVIVLVGVFKSVMVVVRALSASYAVMAVKTQLLAKDLLNQTAAMNLSAAATARLTVAANVATVAATGLAAAFRTVWVALGGWVGMAATAISLLVSFAATAKDAKAEILDLSHEVDAFTASVANMSKMELGVSRAGVVEELTRVNTELEATQAHMAEIRTQQEALRAKSVTGGEGAMSAQVAESLRLDQAMNEALATERALQAEREAGRAKLLAIAEKMLEIQRATGEVAESAEAMNAAFAKAAQSLVEQDPVLSLKKQVEELNRLKTAVDADTQLTAKQKQDRLDAINRKLEDLRIQSDKLAHARGPAEEYFRGIQAAASPATAALYAYQDRVKQLQHAREQGMDRGEYQQQLEAAALAYQAAAKDAALFANEVKAVGDAANPAEAVMRAYADAVMLAQRALAGGASREAVDEYLRQQAELMNKNLKLLALEGDTVGKLAARYDPLIALERDRQQQLAEIEGTVKSNTVTEEEYTAAKELAIAALNREYDAKARLLALDEDKLVQLAAKYDPLVAVELERTRALIQMQDAIASLNVSEAERIALVNEFTTVINDNYDLEARRAKGSIELADAWKEAWRSAIERVDGAFVDLWKSAFKSLDNFKDQLKDLGKQIAAELAHAAVTRPLVMKVGAMLTGEKEPGKILSSGVMGTVMEKLGLAQTPGNKPFATRPAAVETIRDGILAAFAGGAGAGAGVSQTFSRAFSDAFKGLSGLFAPFEEGVAAFSGDIRDFSSTVDGMMSPDTFAQLYYQNKGVLGHMSAGQVAETIGMTPEQAAATGVAGSSSGGGLNIGYMNTALKAIGKFSTSFSMFASSFSGNFGAYLSGSWVPASQYGAMVQSGAAGYGAVAGQMAGAAAYGAVAGYGTNMILGQRGDPTRNMAFSAVGGIIGNAFLPGFGALIGGAIGSLVDNIIGGAKELKEFSLSIQTEGDKLSAWTTQRIKVSDSWFKSHTETTIEPINTQTYEALAGQFHALQAQLRLMAEGLGVGTEAIDEFAVQLKVSLKGLSEQATDKKMQQTALNLMGKQIMEFVYLTEGISDRMKILTYYYRAYTRDFVEFTSKGGFSGILTRYFDMISTVDTSGRASGGTTTGAPGILGAVQALLGYMQDNPQNYQTDTPASPFVPGTLGNFPEEFLKIFEVITALETAMTTSPSAGGQRIVDEGVKTLSEKYAELSAKALEVAKHFDGTMAGLEAVTEAYITQKQAAWDLAAALKTASTEISKMFADTAETIRTSLMQPEELYNYRKAQADNLVTLLSQTTDPGELSNIASQINTIVTSLYQGLDESQRTAMAPEFLTFLTGVDDIVQSQIEEGLAAVDSSALAVDKEITDILLSTVFDMSQSTENFATSLGVFSDATDRFGQSVAVFEQVVNTMEDFWGNYQPSPTTPVSAAPSNSGSTFGLIASRVFGEVNA